MSLKRILGTILASRMGARGRRRGPLGAASLMTGRRRRSSLGGKAGLAALGYMAYKAYQDSQSSTAGSARAGGRGAATQSAGSGGLAGMVQDVVNRVTGGQSTQSSATGGPAAQPSADTSPPADHDLAEEASAAEQMSEETALLLIRAMITAAYSDGALSTAERERIVREIDEAGGDAEDRRILESEIANPKPLDDLLAEVNDQETAEEFYLASCAAIDTETAANRAYLDDLRHRLGLTEEQAAEIEELN